MPMQWEGTARIRGEDTTPHDWLRDHYSEYTAREAAEILSTLGLGHITRSGVRHHLKDKLGLSYGRGRKPSPTTDRALDDDRVIIEGVRAHAVITALKRHKTLTLHQLSEILDRSESTVESVIAEMTNRGFAITQDHRRVTLPQRPVVDVEPSPLFPNGNTTDVALGIISDTHTGSKFEQVTAVHNFVHIAQEEYGVKHVLHAGDAFAGINVYRGQQSEIYAHTAEEQAEAVANNLPRHKGLQYYLLGGNHDYSFYKLAGLDVRTLLESKGRDDITLLDYDVATLPLLPGIDARLWHPSGGPAYALSYRGQKYASQVGFDELMAVVLDEKPAPTIRPVVVGHFHTIFMFEQGPMTILGAGCFEGTNSYLKRKGLVPYIGGWILQCRFVDGMLHRITPTLIRYREIEDDWKGWWLKRQPKREATEVLEPIFSLKEPTRN